jgi:hypothetical protein
MHNGELLAYVLVAGLVAYALIYMPYKIYKEVRARGPMDNIKKYPLLFVAMCGAMFVFL